MTEVAPTTPPRPAKPNRKARNIRVGDVVWKRLVKEAAGEGITAPELLRRIVDIHFVKDSLFGGLVARVQALEERVRQMESELGRHAQIGKG